MHSSNSALWCERTGELSSVQLTQYMLERIAQVDPVLKRYATVMGEQALAVNPPSANSDSRRQREFGASSRIG
jgi:Asp-tRNA(Asn)/Glu-tRNA(Gln) amidotransferase A subunit family amidase